MTYINSLLIFHCFHVILGKRWLMIEGIGTDIIEIARLKKAIARHGDHFLRRIFTDPEIEYCSKKATVESFAVRFAAKEALFKATGLGWREGLSWKDFEILNDSYGKPIVHLYGKARELLVGKKIHLSLSHSQTMASAFVIIEGGMKGDQ